MWGMCRGCVHLRPDDCLSGPRDRFESSWREFPRLGMSCPRRITRWGHIRLGLMRLIRGEWRA
jgi:hypothetical protein